jgi:hypothetical protein
MNIIDEIHKIIHELNVVLKVSVPNRVLQLNYKETQTIYGIYKSLNVYNNSTNDQIIIVCKLKNNFFAKSKIFFEINKTHLTASGLSFDNYKHNFFEGTCEEANEIFEALKKEFYDPHIKIPVPPKQ